MSLFDAITAAGGLAFFLYGMTNMGKSLEKLGGGKLEKTLQTVTGSLWKSILFGAIVTACIQSSSATTVIVVGLVNSGIMKLTQAVGVIMGANIGTTITAQILRLGDIDSSNLFLSLLKPKSFAPIVAVVGIVLIMMAKRSKTKNLGEILINFGILFTGMYLMEGAFSSLQEVPAFQQLFTSFSNPVLGVLVGTLVTALIQSSSASIGILQALAATGSITYSTAIPIILGQNIGTCITAILASIGANKNAKRAAMIHLYFNIIGTIVFMVGIYTFQFTVGFSFWNDVVTRGNIADFHTMFNIVCTLLLAPFSKQLVKLANLTIRDKQSETPEEAEVVLDERLLTSPSLALERSKEALLKMAHLAQKNFEFSVNLLDNYDTKIVERIEENENSIDKLQGLVENYLLKITDTDLTDRENRDMSEQLHLINEWERIGDYAINISERAGEKFDKAVKFSDKASKEIGVLCNAIKEVVGDAVEAFRYNNPQKARCIEPLEETIDIMCDVLKEKHINRLKNGKCAIESGIIFLEVLTNVERIADHCSNIGLYIVEDKTSTALFDGHQYVKRLHAGEDEEYNQLFEEYSDKYLSRIKKQ